jgi:hypothetical protein
MADPEDDETDGGQEKVEIVTAQRAGQDNAADPKQVRDKARKVRTEQRDAVDFWTMVMGTEDGRRKIWAFLHEGEGHPFETRFGTAGGFPQPEASWLEAGKQSHSFEQWMSLLVLVPELAMLMFTENDFRVVGGIEANIEKPRRPSKGPSHPPR